MICPVKAKRRLCILLNLLHASISLLCLKSANPLLRSILFYLIRFFLRLIFKSKCSITPHHLFCFFIPYFFTSFSPPAFDLYGCVLRLATLLRIRELEMQGYGFWKDKILSSACASLHRFGCSCRLGYRNTDSQTNQK